MLDSTIGAPTSHFIISGSDFPPTSTIALALNGVAIGSVQANTLGFFSLTLTTDEASPGFYGITADTGMGAFAAFILSTEASLHMPSDSETRLAVPAGLAYVNFIYLPAVAHP